VGSSHNRLGSQAANQKIRAIFPSSDEHIPRGCPFRGYVDILLMYAGFRIDDRRSKVVSS
jgi:hypothetical protein